ncbi:hypothetical protein HAQ00_00740 [Acidithiobacillus caldus ATCC 51756]|uniref:hypothetical protein n=1 Tax=Acidithiobacillus caldus TaxID=33059 RepID=UPI001C070F0D|nr:hypothetical protein [Acidithiobacillus caldus]MBU2734279.1 hypothetical protein [Acidithiobacillus caldus ATCC 51756]MBU2801739.1 hypothetical protein [Acidithiobacillus caldus]
MEWKPLDGKKKPKAPERVLVAWREKHGAKFVCLRYGILVHWPDGVWTTELREPLSRESLPDFWSRIDPPPAEERIAS